jgi:hypothetical protein
MFNTIAEFYIDDTNNESCIVTCNKTISVVNDTNGPDALGLPGNVDHDKFCRYYNTAMEAIMQMCNMLMESQITNKES